MQHTGNLFLGHTKPVADRNDAGDFQLTLLLIDNLGHLGKEAYRVRWTGPEANAFWSAHRDDLVPGAIVYVELTHLRAHVGTTRPPLPELRARVARATYCPRRQHHTAAAAA